MNLGLISLILLLAAIVIGFVRNCNVGIICVGFSMILGIAYNLSIKDIIAGFSSSLFIQMVGITYLFAIINGNGTLELLANKLVRLVGKKKHLVPFVMYVLGFAICAVGPGAIPSLAIVPVIAIPVAVSAGVNPIMTAIIGDLGVMSGRMSPLTPESAVVRELMEEQGLTGNTLPIMAAITITALVTAVVVYIYYKGWQIDPSVKDSVQEKLPAFNLQQWLSLAGLVVLAVGALFFSWNVGLTGFLIGSVLLVLGCGNEKKSNCSSAMECNSYGSWCWNSYEYYFYFRWNRYYGICFGGGYGKTYRSNDHGYRLWSDVILQFRSWCCVPDSDSDSQWSECRSWCQRGRACGSNRSWRYSCRIYSSIYHRCSDHGRCFPAGERRRKISTE